MRAIEAETFSGYGGLRQTELSKPAPAKDRVLVRVTAAGVTPLDHTILSGAHPRAKAPLVLGNEGSNMVVQRAGEALRRLTEDRPFGQVGLAGDAQRPLSPQKPNLRTTKASP